MDIKNLKLKSYGKWNLLLAAVNFGAIIFFWNPFVFLNAGVGAFLVYDAFETKPSANS